MVRVPKIVDFDARRAEIVRATWRLIAREGIAGTTMRRLADELGLANGALTVYFPNKRAILAAAFAHVFATTNQRYDAARGSGLRGVDALHAFLTELFPMDEERMLEARIVIPFLEYAAHDAAMRELYEGFMSQWEREIDTLLCEMIDDGQAPRHLDRAAFVDHVLAVTNGVQTSSVLKPRTATPERLEAMIASVLAAAR